MKFGTLLNNLAKKAGVDTTQKNFADLLAHDIEIPDDIAGIMERGLMNIEAAKNHPEIKKAIRTETLNGVDAKVLEIMEGVGIDDDDIKNERNSYDKVSKLVNKVKELEAKKVSSNKGADKEAYEKQIADLNNQIRVVKENLSAKEKEFNNSKEESLKDFQVYKKLLGKNYALPAEMDSDLKLEFVHSTIKKELLKKGYDFVRDAETGTLKIVNKEGLQAYNDKNEALEVDSFIDGALAQNKLLKVNDQSQQGSGNTHSTHMAGGQQQNPLYQQRVNEVDKQLADLGVTV